MVVVNERPPGHGRLLPAVGGRSSTPSPLWGLAGLVVSLLPVLLFSAARLSNTDTWFHLTLGRHFLDDWSLSHPGGLTPFATSPWVPSQWLPEVVAAWVEGNAGLPGVAWLFGALYLAVILTVWYVARRRGTPAVASLGTFVFVFAAAPVLSARPQILSVGLVVVVLHLWLGAVDDGRPRWWLAAVHWAWCMLHGLWSVGLLLGLVAVAGALLDRRWSRRQALWQMAVLAASALVTLATPLGPRLVTSQLAVSARTALIPEWGPTSFRELSPLLVAATAGVLVVVWARRSGPIDWTRILLLGLAVGSSIWVVRLVPLAAAVVVVLLAEAVRPARVRVRDDESGHGPLDRVGRSERGLVGALALCYLVALALLVPHTAIEPEGVPSRLGPRLDSLADGSVVMVEDGIGSWIEWRDPQVHPVIDGMLDAYPVDYIQGFFDAKAVKPGWQRFVADSNARDAVTLMDSPLTLALQQRLGWREVATDGRWVYLVAPESAG